MNLDDVFSHRPAWHADGLCRKADPGTFFPVNADGVVRAQRICNACPVKAACLTWALEHNEYGLWGGTSERQRRRLREGLPRYQPRHQTLSEEQIALILECRAAGLSRAKTAAKTGTTPWVVQQLEQSGAA